MNLSDRVRHGVGEDIAAEIRALEGWKDSYYKVLAEKNSLSTAMHELEEKVVWCDKRIENWYKPENERLRAAIEEAADKLEECAWYQKADELRALTKEVD